MNMQHNRDQFDDAEPIRSWSYDVEIRPYADFKLQKAIDQRQLEIRQITMASRRITEDYPHLAAWFCLAVKPGAEFSVEKALEAENIEVFLPRHPPKKVLKRGRRIEVAARPVLAGYILVRCVARNEALRGLLDVRGVVGVVGDERKPWRVGFEEMQRFRDLTAAGEFSEADDDASKFCAGMKIKVTEGPFAGFPAIVAKPEGKGGVIAPKATEIAVEIAIFGRITPAVMPIAWLKVM